MPLVLGFAMEILMTLQVMVENMESEKVILYPQLFWGCVAMMHTDFVHVYQQVLVLFARVINRLQFRDRTTELVLLSSMPRDELDTGNTDQSDFNRQFCFKILLFLYFFHGSVSIFFIFEYFED